MRNILFVDSAGSCNSSFRRLVGDKVGLTCAASAEEALDLLKDTADFQVILTDYSLPGMRGTELLSKVREAFPGIVRIMICGKLNQNIAINAINECGVFKLLTKPCPASVLRMALRDAFEHYRVLNSDKDLLDDSVRSVIRLVNEVASLLKPERNARTTRIMPTIKAMCRKLGDPDPWSTEVAAVLSMIGFVFLPDELMEKVEDGVFLSGHDHETYIQHTRYSAKLISGVPRLENVATILSLQEANYIQDSRDGGFAGDEIPLGARILRVVSDYDRLSMGDRTKGEIISMMKRRAELYDPKVLECLVGVLGSDATFYIREVYPLGLEAGMILAEDVYGLVKGKMLKFLSEGQTLSDKTIDYIHKNGETILDVTKKIKIRENLVLHKPSQSGEA